MLDKGVGPSKRRCCRIRLGKCRRSCLSRQVMSCCCALNTHCEVRSHLWSGGFKGILSCHGRPRGAGEEWMREAEHMSENVMEKCILEGSG